MGDIHVVALGGLLLGLSCGSIAVEVHIVHGLFTRTEDRIAIDGRLDEPAWTSAPPLSRFFEVYPANIGEPAYRTEARFLYDQSSLYIGIRAYDPNPGTIRSAVTRRDQVLADQDYVELLVEAQNGRRTALLFRVNPKGVPTDGVFDEHAQLPDYSVDLKFDVAARVNELGWTAEFRIPLSTLRYRQGHDQAWTIGIRRKAS